MDVLMENRSYYTDMDIDIAQQLEIMPGDILYLPGCEPTSAVTGKTLNAMIAQACKKSTINLTDALKAIPGSYVKYGVNYNRRGTRQKWLVLPSKKAGCPCDENVDYFQMLKDIAFVDEPEEYKYDTCNTIGEGFSPSPEFAQYQPPQDPYSTEGDFYGGTGFLPPVPPWSTAKDPTE